MAGQGIPPEQRQAAEQALNSGSLTSRQVTGPLVAPAPRTARLSGLCAPQQHKDASQKSRNGNAARPTSSHAITAGPASNQKQPLVDASTAVTNNTAMLAYADAGNSAGSPARHTTAPPPPDAQANNMLAAALASHVQQRVSYRQPQCSPNALSWPRATDSQNRFTPYVPGTSDFSVIPPYDDTVSPGIQYIEEEVVGPVPPAELAVAMPKVKVEPCSSVHDLGTGDSQGCSHTVAQMPVLPWGVAAWDSAAVDSASPGQSGGAGQAARAPPGSVPARAQAAHADRAHAKAKQSATHASDAGEGVDALAILADIALADSSQDAKLSSEAPQGHAAAAHDAPAARAGSPHRAEVRKKRSLLLSAVVAPVAAQRGGSKDAAPAKKRKPAQPPASKLTKALRQAAATAAEMAPKPAQDPPGLAAPAAEAAAKPLKKTTQLAAVNAARSLAPPSARKATVIPSLPPLAAAAPQSMTGQRRIANTPRPLNVMRPLAPQQLVYAPQVPTADPAAAVLGALRSVPPQTVHSAACAEHAAAARLAQSRANLAAAMAAHQEAHYAAARAAQHRLQRAAAAAADPRQPQPYAAATAHSLAASLHARTAENGVPVAVGAPQTGMRSVHPFMSWPVATQPHCPLRAVAPHVVTCVPERPQAAAAPQGPIGPAAATAAASRTPAAPLAAAPVSQVAGDCSASKQRHPAAAVAATEDGSVRVDRIRLISAAEPDPNSQVIAGTVPASAHVQKSPQTGKAMPGPAASSHHCAPPGTAPVCKAAPHPPPVAAAAGQPVPQPATSPGRDMLPASSIPAPAIKVEPPDPASRITNAAATAVAASSGTSAAPSAPVEAPAAAPVTAASPAGAPAPAAAQAAATATAGPSAREEAPTAPADAQASRNASPAELSARKAARGSGQNKPIDLDAVEIAKMAAKIQMQAEKAALKAQNAAERMAANMRTRKRRAPQSITYPLLDGIPKRKGVYYRKKEQSFEAQLDTSVFKSAQHISGGRIIYLGLYSCKPDDEGSVKTALERATRSLDRTKVKLLEGCVSSSELAGCLQYPLKDYQTSEEVDMRKARTLKEFANFLKIKSDAKRPQHGKKGVAARTRRSGAIIYEARITHIPIGSFGTYTTLEDAKLAFDLGAILCKGVDWQINEPLTEYMLDGAFHSHVIVPRHVVGCIQKYLNGLQEIDPQKHEIERSRIMGYFRDSQCPFY